MKQPRGPALPSTPAHLGEGRRDTVKHAERRVACDDANSRIESAPRSCGGFSSPYLTTAEAATYLRYRSASSIRTLKMKGLLRPAGRRGNVDLYRRDDLDRFVTGTSDNLARRTIRCTQEGTCCT